MRAGCNRHFDSCEEFAALWQEEAGESDAKHDFSRVLLHCSRTPRGSPGNPACDILTEPKRETGNHNSYPYLFIPLNTDSMQNQKLNFWIERGGVVQVQSTRGLPPDYCCKDLHNNWAKVSSLAGEQ